jgi:hypothetical protein
MARYYQIYEYQAIEEEIRNEYICPAPPAKPRALPPPKRMAELVQERIQALADAEK